MSWFDEVSERPPEIVESSLWVKKDSRWENSTDRLAREPDVFVGFPKIWFDSFFEGELAR